MTILLIFLAVLALTWFAVWSTADQDYVPSGERNRPPAVKK